MQYSNTIISKPDISKLPESAEIGDMKGLHILRQIARRCLYAQFFAAFVYFFLSLVFPQSENAAILCGILAITISLTPIFYAFTQSSLVYVFSCISVINLAPIWFLYLEAVLPGYDAFEHSDPVYRMEMFFWTAVFQVFVNVFYLLFWSRVNRFSVKTFSFLQTLKINHNLFGILTVLAVVIPIVGFYFYYNSVEKLWIHLTAGRSEEGVNLKLESVGKLGALLEPLTWLLQLTPLLGSIAFVSAPNKMRLLPILSVILTVVVIFLFFLGGTRGIMMAVAAPALFFLVYYNWHKGLKFWVPAMFGLVLLIGVMELQVRFRGNLLNVIINPEKAAREQNLQSVTTFDPSKSHRDNNTYLFCLMIKGYPDKYEFEGFNNMLAMLVNPIPRALWPNKPVLIGAKDLSQQPKWVTDGPLYMETTSLTWSVVGDGYQAKGILGLLVYGFIYGLFVVFFDGIVYYTKNKQPLAAGLLGMGVFLSFWGYRSLFALVTSIYPVLFMLLAISAIQFIKKISRL